MRKYDLAEIERMRAAAQSLLMGSGYRPVTTGRDDKDTAEDRLRTYMLNGTDPEELEKYAKLKLEQLNLAQQVRDAERLMKQHSCQHDWGDSHSFWENCEQKYDRVCKKCHKRELVVK